jgi:hypothetical protein
MIKTFTKNKIWQNIMILILLAVLCFLIRLPYSNFPLDNDEGNYYAFYSFSSIRENFNPSVAISRMPGIVLTYRLIDNFFPGNIIALRIAATFLLSVASFVIFKIGELNFGRRVGIISAIAFIFLPTLFSPHSPANREFFMTPFIIFSFFFYFLYQKHKKNLYLAFSGLFIGIAIFYKQMAVFEAIFLASYLLISSNSIKALYKNIPKFLYFGLSAIIPFLITLIYLLMKGEFIEPYLFSLSKGNSYIGYAWKDSEWISRLISTFSHFWKLLWPVWLFVLIGFINILFSKIKNKKIFFGWFFSALIGSFFTGWFFSHYFIQVTPMISIMFGVSFIYLFEFVNRMTEKKKAIKILSNLLLVLLAFFIFLKNFLPIGYDYSKYLSGKLSFEAYIEKQGFDISDSGWLPYYQTSDYFRQHTKGDESVFVWGESPVIYYLLRRNPTYSFIKNYDLLDYRFMLDTSKGFNYEFQKNRIKLLDELIAKPPDYVIIDAHPRLIFDQLFLYKEFSNFVYNNYIFEKKIGFNFIYKINKERNIVKSNLANDALIPLELITNLSAVVDVNRKNNSTEIFFEPMINDNGILRKFKVIYPGGISFKTLPLEVLFIDRDNSDYVSAHNFIPNGNKDLHLKIKGLPDETNFIRIKVGGITWNSRLFGVNPPILVNQMDNIFDLYIDSSSDFEGKEFEIYFIYKNGSIGFTSLVFK